MDDGVSLCWSIPVCAILLVCQIIVSEISAGIRHCSEHELARIHSRSKRGKRLLIMLREKPDVCVRVESWISVYLSTAFAILQFAWWNTYLTKLSGLGFILSLCLILFLIMGCYVLLGIFVPRCIYTKKAPVFRHYCIAVFYVLYFLAGPLAGLFYRLAGQIGRLFGVDPMSEADDVMEEEIISMVNESHEQGVLLASEAAMIQNIFEFGEKDVKDVMVHRKHIVGIDGEMTLSEAISYISGYHFSRYPVYLKDLDNIQGIFLLKDALGHAQSKEYDHWKIKDIPDFIHEVEFVPETHSINTLFTKMQSQKNHMVIVVDEYGQTSGITSMEDILEEIVGNIWDEHDEASESIERVTDGFFLMEGISDLDEVAQTLGVTFPDGVETLNGFLISQIDKIPADHETFTVCALGYEFHVSDVENKMIQSVRVTKL